MDNSTIGPHIQKIYATPKTANIECHIQMFMRKYNFPNLHTAQIFVAVPTNFQFTVKGDQIDSLKEFIKRTGIHIYAHARYLDNLFSAAVRPSTLGFIRKELKICCEADIKGFIVHLYKYPPETVVEALKTLDPPKNPIIMLETPAIKPDNAIYNTPQSLCNIYQLTHDVNLNTGICVDTCHIYASGAHIDELDVMKSFFEPLIKCIPPQNLLIHLNDSMENVGSGRDRHASLGKGLIWGKDKRSLKWLLNFIHKYKIDAILERNEGNGNLQDDFDTIDSLLL